MHSFKQQPMAVTKKYLIIKTFESHQLLKIISAEIDTTEITSLLRKQISGTEILQLG